MTSRLQGARKQSETQQTHCPQRMQNAARQLSAIDKLAYFKDNVHSPEEQERFDASRYYYSREDGSHLAAMQHPDQSRQHMHNFPHGGYSAVAASPYGGWGGSQRPPMPPGALPRQSSAGSISMAPGAGSGGYSQGPLSLGAIGRQSSTPVSLMEGQQYMQPAMQRSASGGYSSVVGSMQGPPGSGMYQSPMSGMMGGPSSGPSEGVQFDASDFPSLSAATSRSGFGAQQQQPQQQQQPEFAIQSEDFPALPGAEKSESKSQSQQRQAQPAAAAAAATTRPEARDARSNKYGLLGLLDVIRMSDRDLNTLALGSDLTTFGLNLNSAECLYSSFVSPFVDNLATKEPRFHIPACYKMRSPTLKAEHLSKFNLDTLFYIFYALPRDMLQSATALELYKREWRWHTELRAWLLPNPQQDAAAAQGNPQFFVFDANAWEVRVFSGARGNLVAGFASEDDIRNPQVLAAPPTTS